MTTPTGGNTAAINELLAVFADRPLNIDRLKECGRVHGFENHFGRNLAWNEIIENLKVDEYKNEPFDQLKKRADESTTKHKFVHQIHIDVERSLNSIDFFDNLTEKEIKYHRENLEDLMQTFFTLNPQYSYYQGFHDVATLLLYNLDALKFPFEQSVTLQLRLILRIVHVFDPHYADSIGYFYEGTPIFALPWVLTWFSHSLKEIGQISRIFDFLISSPPYSVIYMCAAILLMLKKELIGSAEEIDMACVHSFFQNLQIPNVELLVSTTIELERTCDIYRLISKLEKPFPNQSSITSARHFSMINKYYYHQLQKVAAELIPKRKSQKLRNRQIVTGIGVAALLVILTIVSRKISVSETIPGNPL